MTTHDIYSADGKHLLVVEYRTNSESDQWHLFPAAMSGSEIHLLNSMYKWTKYRARRKQSNA